MILLVTSSNSKSIVHTSFTGPSPSVLDCSSGLQAEPFRSMAHVQQQVRNAATGGRSDGRLERDDVCAFDQVFVFTVDQRIPTVEILVQTCETQESKSAAETFHLSCERFVLYK